MKKQEKSKSLSGLIIWMCAALFYGYQFCLRISVSVMDQELMHHFAVDVCALGVLAAWYYHAYVFMQVPAGSLLDHYGPRRTLCFAIIGCIVGNILFLVSPSVSGAALGRFLIGAGSAFAFLSCVKIATSWFASHKQPMFIGLTVATGTLSASGGGALLSFLVQMLGWQTTMTIFVGAGAVLLGAVLLIVKDKPAAPLPEGELVSNKGFIASFLPNLTTIAKQPQAWLIGLYGLLGYLPLSAIADLWGVSFLMNVHGLDKTTAATINSCIYFGMFIGSPLWPILTSYQKNYRFGLGLSTALSCIILALILQGGNGLSVLTLSGLFLTLGFAAGGQFLAFNAASALMPKELAATTSAFHNMICMSSGVIFQPLIGWILEKTGASPSISVADSYFWALSTIPLGLGLASAMIVFLIKETYPHSEEH